MKILYITSQPILINSSANLRNVALIKGLMELGHEVKILNMRVTENAANFDNSIKDHLGNIEIQYIDPIKIHNSMVVKKESKQSLVRKFKNIARQLYMKFSIYDSLALSYKNVGNILPPKDKFDIIISSSDLKSSHLIAREFIKRFCSGYERWVQYWGDPLALDINMSSKWPLFFLKKAEHKVLQNADKIVYVSPYTLIEQKKMYPELANKMHFVPVGYIEKRITKSLKTEKKSSKIMFSYFGDYGSKARNIVPLYNAAQELPIILKVVGNSDIQLQATEDITIEGRKPYELIRFEEENSDVLICLCNSSGTQIPGKIYHYSSLDKPILVIKDGSIEIDKYLNKYDDNNKFYYCDNNVDSIKETINWILEHWSNIETSPLEAFSPKEIAKQFLDEIGEG